MVSGDGHQPCSLSARTISRTFSRAALVKSEPAARPSRMKKRGSGRRSSNRRAARRLRRRHCGEPLIVAPQPLQVDRAELRIMGDRPGRIVILIIASVDDVGAAPVIVEGPVGAELDEGREAAADGPTPSGSCTEASQSSASGNAREEAAVAGQPVEVQQLLDIGRARVRDQSARLVGPGAGDVEPQIILQAPARLAARGPAWSGISPSPAAPRAAARAGPAPARP